MKLLFKTALFFVVSIAALMFLFGIIFAISVNDPQKLFYFLWITTPIDNAVVFVFTLIIRFLCIVCGGLLSVLLLEDR